MGTGAWKLSRQAVAIQTCWRDLIRCERALDRHRKALALRDWRVRVRDRQGRTQLLIEYGGLVVIAGLPDRVADDHVTLLGGFLRVADLLDGLGKGDDPPADLLARWRRRGLRAFNAGAGAAAKASASVHPGSRVSALNDQRDRLHDRKARARRLIEFGALVLKAGLPVGWTMIAPPCSALS